MDGFDAYLGGWSFRIYNSSDATTVALQEAVARPDLALAYAAGVVDAVARSAAKTRATLTAALGPLLLLGADTPPPSLPLQRYHPYYCLAYASAVARSASAPVTVPRPTLPSVVALSDGSGRNTDRRAFDLALTIADQDAAARTPRAPTALATEISRILS